MQRTPQFLIGFLVAVFCTPAVAGGAVFSANLDRQTIRLGESAVLSLTVQDGQPDRAIQLPPVQFLEFSGGAQRQSISIINNRRSFSFTYSYDVKPLQAGTFTIPPITASVGGREQRSQPLSLKVLPRSAQVENGMAFVDLRSTTEEVYVGQPFRVEVHLYFQAGKVRQLPELASDGFTFTDLDHTQRQIVKDGRVYHLVVFPKVAVPVKAGRLKVGPARCPFELHIPTGRRDFFGRSHYSTHDVSPESKPVEINVLPLPNEGRPDQFSGAVGRFKMDVQAGPTNLVAGDPITLEVSIAGNGVLENVKLPSFEAWGDFRVYPPNSSISYQDQGNFVGIKTFEQVVVPEQADVPELPGFRFSFFDPYERRYKTLEQPGIPLVVAPAAAANNTPVIMVTQTNQPGDIPKIATQLVHIKPSIGTIYSGSGAGVWVLPAATFFAWMALLVKRRREEKLENNPRLRRRLEVDGVIESGLGTLARQAGEGSGEEFFKTMTKLLQERLGERLDLPASAITESVIHERLGPAGVDPEICRDLERLFEACNQARYAPSHDSGELQKLAVNTGRVVNRLREVEIE